MNRVGIALILMALIGCHESESLSSSGENKVQHGPHQLVVDMDMHGEMHVNAMEVAPADLPELVQQWHITSAKILGAPGSKFSDALKVQSELKDAGVQDVTIASNSDD